MENNPNGNVVKMPSEALKKTLQTYVSNLKSYANLNDSKGQDYSYDMVKNLISLGEFLLQNFDRIHTNDVGNFLDLADSVKKFDSKKGKMLGEERLSEQDSLEFIIKKLMHDFKGKYGFNIPAHMYDASMKSRLKGTADFDDFEIIEPISDFSEEACKRKLSVLDRNIKYYGSELFKNQMKLEFEGPIGLYDKIHDVYKELVSKYNDVKPLLEEMADGGVDKADEKTFAEIYKGLSHAVMLSHFLLVVGAHDYQRELAEIKSSIPDINEILLDRVLDDAKKM